MSRSIKDTGEYSVKETGESIGYEFEFSAYDSIDDATADLGKDKVLALVNRMSKVDANNTAREKAKVKNGHSTRKPLTPEQKTRAKAERKVNADILATLKSKGLSLEDIKNL